MKYASFWDTLQQPIIALAPMDGVTDAPCRTMHGLYGRPDVVLTELTNVEERVRIWGDHAQIERRRLPVSVKTRLGYDSIVITDWVQELLELEPHVISIHGRTLAQHYKGDANWEAIAAAAEIVRKTDTLILGNGDIHSLYQAAQRIRTSVVSGVLIGRASFGNPWLFRDREQLKKLLNAGINPTAEDLPEAAPSREERLLMALEHARVHAKLKGEDHFVELRKHMGWD